MLSTNFITYILLSIIVIVILIDQYQRRKKKLATSTNIEKESVNKASSNKRFGNIALVLLVSVLILTASFFALDHFKFDGKLSDTDDGISLVQNLTLDKIYSNDIVVSDSMWVSRNSMQKLSCIVVDTFGNYNGVIIDGYQQGLWRYFYQQGTLKAELSFLNGRGINISESSKIPLDGRDGRFNFWYENGQLWAERNYVDGDIVGTNKEWYENGQFKGNMR